jgi:hypothetical protein
MGGMKLSRNAALATVILVPLAILVALFTFRQWLDLLGF